MKEHRVKSIQNKKHRIASGDVRKHEIKDELQATLANVGKCFKTPISAVAYVCA